MGKTLPAPSLAEGNLGPVGPRCGVTECLELCGGTKSLVSGADVYQKIPGLLEAEYGSRRVFLIADTHTMRAAGDKLEKVLSEGGIEVSGRYIFPAEPRLHADYCHIGTIVQKIGTGDQGSGTGDSNSDYGIASESNPDTSNNNPRSPVPADSAAGDPQSLSFPQSPVPIPVAVGAGTINDLVKRAAFELSLPYLCVPTAASVDGFTSYGAAILKDGFKQTLPCDAPRCIVADTGVLSRAPAWLSSSGFADLAGKIVAGADWIIADTAASFGAKGAGAIEPTAWAMVQNGLYDYLSRSVTAAQGDPDALGALFEALSITGFAMQYARDSRPVSGAEHLFAHVWEMDDLCVNGYPVTHGHKVAIGTLAATAFIETLFADPDGPPPPPAGFRPPSLDEQIAEAKSAFGTGKASPALDGVIKTVTEKFPDAQNAARFRDGICGVWKDLRAKVLDRIMPYPELKALFLKARCPVLPGEVNLTRNEITACARRARMIRNRYSSLDLAWDLGCFETVLERMEGSEKYFF